MLKSFSIFALLGSLVFAANANAQKHPIADFFRDYFKLVPRAYSPDDPWTMGHILRTEVGHGGCFYNCDGEEQKRYSPYIRWNCQNVDCPKRLIQDPLLHQLHEIKQRVRWGACAGCGDECYSGYGHHHAHGGGCNCAGVSQVFPQADAAMAVQQPRQELQQTPPETFPKPLQIPPQNAQQNQRKVVYGLLEQHRRQNRLPVAPPETNQPVASTSVEARQNIARLLQQARGNASGDTINVANESNQSPASEPPQKLQRGFLVQLLSPVAPQPSRRGMETDPVTSEPATTRTADKAAAGQPTSRQGSLSNLLNRRPSTPPTRQAAPAPVRQAENQQNAPTADTDSGFRMIRR